MPVISTILGTAAGLADRITAGEDPVLLSSEERASAHGPLTTRGGRRLNISLPRGTELNDGDVLAIENGTAIVVRPAAEALFVVRPRTALEWGIAGFHLGNLHRPVRFRDDAILTPAEPKAAEVLRDAGIAFEERETPFVGRRYGSYSGHGHSHSHSHGPGESGGDSHGHDHGHLHRHDEDV